MSIWWEAQDLSDGQYEVNTCAVPAVKLRLYLAYIFSQACTDVPQTPLIHVTPLFVVGSAPRSGPSDVVDL